MEYRFMKVVIFGAAGQTGKHLVRQALDAGHSVTAFVRDPAKLGVTHTNLRIVQGTSTDAAAVERAVEGQDAVISALGQVKPFQPGLMVQTATNIVNAMKKHGVKRLVYLTGAGVTTPKDPPSFAARVIVPLMKVVAGPMLEDSAAGVRLDDRARATPGEQSAARQLYHGLHQDRLRGIQPRRPGRLHAEGS
jgi:hypothetical protein